MDARGSDRLEKQASSNITCVTRLQYIMTLPRLLQPFMAGLRGFHACPGEKEEKNQVSANALFEDKCPIKSPLTKLKTLYNMERRE